MPRQDHRVALRTMTRHRLFFAFFILILALLSAAEIRAQGVNFGIPPMWNFPKKTYRAGTQNWDAAQDSRGVLYWANNNGLLRYDGTNWSCLPVANHTIVRSVVIDAATDRIFVGAQSEMGYFSLDKNGCLAYHSLVGLLPESQRTFEDVWDIAFAGDDVFFRTNRVVFQYSNGRIRTHEPGGELTALFATNRGLVLQQDFSRLLVFQNGVFEPFFQVFEIQSALTGALPWQGDTLLLTSLKNGVFYISGDYAGRWTTLHDALLREKRIYASTALPNGQLALGTSLDGLIVLDRQRRVFRHLTKKSGLQNNNILNTFSDRSGNLWLGLDNGIDCVMLNSPFTSVIPDGELQGTGYTAAVFQNRLYLGVSNGVYTAPWQSFYDPENEPFFQKVSGSDGQVWSLITPGNELLMGHHEGAFRLEGQQAGRLSAGPGAWTFVPLSAGYLLGGAYDGLSLYRKSGQNWVYDQKLPGLDESCRIMVKDADGAVWVSHPYRGVYRVDWSPGRKNEIAVKFFNARNGLPSDLNNYVFQIAGKAVFATEKGVYRYDQTTGAFIPDQDFNRMLGTSNRVQYLREDARGNIWYVTAQEVGLLLIDDFGLKKTVRKKIFPELTGKLVGGFEFIYPVDESNVFFGAEQGFIHYNAAAGPGADTMLQVVFSAISASGTRDSMLYGGVWPSASPDAAPVLEAGWNNLRFAFSATDFVNPALIQYRMQLVGLERGWSEWSAETTRDYTNLGPGKYVFQVQARRKNGPESAILTFSFRIRPPWYASLTARVLYALALAGLFGWFLFRQRKKFESEKAQLTVTHRQKEAQHLREVEQSKAALTEIQHEKLEAEIRFKNQELASVTMHLVQKGEILLTIQEALNQILEKSTHPAVKKEIQQLLNLLNFDVKLDEDWEQFAFRFDQVHVDFLKHLRERFPQLSTNDHKLCAFLRMNLITKEIAPLLNISVRGVEASRYRLRKKLGLPNDANLTDFMMDISKLA